MQRGRKTDNVAAEGGRYHLHSALNWVHCYSARHGDPPGRYNHGSHINVRSTALPYLFKPNKALGNP
jgi:hypothetical protein